MTRSFFMNLRILAVAAVLGGCATHGGPPGAPLGFAPQVDAPAARVAGNLQKTLFVADVDKNVLLYTANINAHNPPLLSEITQGVTRSLGIGVDHRTNTLYVVNSGGSQASIAEYKQGTSSPFKTITNGLRAPGSIAIDNTGTLYVADSTSAKAVVLVYAPNANSPSRTIDIPQASGSIGGIALGPKGALIVATFDFESQTGVVYSVAHGSSQPVNLNLQNPPGPSLGVDRAGYIYVGGHFGEISVYAPGSQSPSRFITTNVEGFYTDMDVTPNGTIYWPNFDNSAMFEFASGASGPTNSFSIAGSGIAAGVALW